MSAFRHACIVFAYVSVLMPLSLVNAADTQAQAAQQIPSLESAEAKIGQLRQEVHSAEATEDEEAKKATAEVTQAQSVEKAAEDKARQEDHEAAQAQAAQKAAEAKAEQQVQSSETEAADAQSAQKAAEAKAAQQVHAAEAEAAQARSVLATEEAKDSSKLHFLEAKMSQKEDTLKAKAVNQGNMDELVFLSTSAFLLIVIAAIWKTPQGKAFKERMSQRISGKVGRTEPKKVPLLKAANNVDEKMVGA